MTRKVADTGLGTILVSVALTVFIFGGGVYASQAFAFRQIETFTLNEIVVSQNAMQRQIVNMQQRINEFEQLLENR
ncbi:hypothetical protein IPJ72_03585 [Candidatus Peregrinibacteria bacterium]|nr:MAG: hypothetical protein IPJ72_03585 [Candidatus Peregrinibacteria bacterium]